MAMTLLEAKKLAPDILTETIIEEYAASSDIMMALPFDDVNGTGVHYNQEESLPGVGFRGINEAHEESCGILNPQSEALKLAGGDLDVDRAIVDMQGSGARSTHELMKVKALSLMWTRAFVKGDSRSNPRSFDGLQNRIQGSQLIDNAAAGAALSLAKLDEVIDAVDNPTHIIVSKSIRRLLSQAARDTSIGGHINYSQDAFGRKQTTYADLPLLVADYDNNNQQILPFTEASGDGSATDCASIYVVSFGERMLTGIQGKVGDRFGVSVRDMGELESKPAFRTRIDWYNAIAIYNGKAAARLRGIKNLAVVK